MNLGTETGSLVNHVYSRAVQPTPAVGMGATILAWSDRYAGTIIAVHPDGSFDVQEDKATRTDANGMSESQTYAYEPNPAGRVHKFRVVKRGKAKGELREAGKRGGYGVMVGVRRKYHDFSF
jgi:hypothetical protein